MVTSSSMREAAAIIEESMVLDDPFEVLELEELAVLLLGPNSEDGLTAIALNPRWPDDVRGVAARMASERMRKDRSQVPWKRETYVLHKALSSCPDELVRRGFEMGQGIVN